MASGEVQPSAVVVFAGGDAVQRSKEIGDFLSASAGTALILTGVEENVDIRLDTSEDGPVEVRTPSSSSLVAAYLAGCGGPVDPVLAALCTGSDAPLAACLYWEYVRRAAEVRAWETIVVDLDGDLSAVHRVSAAGILSRFIEQNWPAHRRYSSLAAGHRMDPQLRNAHRLADLAETVARFLSEPIEVHGVGSRGVQTAALVDLARGAAMTTLGGDARTGFRFSAEVPAAPLDLPRVAGGSLVFALPGVDVTIPLPPVLLRCTLTAAEYIDFGHREGKRYQPAAGAASSVGVVEALFDLDPAQWPPTLIQGDDEARTG